MAASKKKERVQRPPATTPESRENQMVAHAITLAEQQLVSGTASAMVITHYLKLGSMRNQLEQQKLRQENELLKAKADAMSSSARVEELYTKALNAMRSYSGNPVEDEEVYFD